MAKSMTRSQGGRTIFLTGPFRGVNNTKDPYDDAPNDLVDAVNMYIPDPKGGSGAYARPGFGLQNPSSPLTADGQGVYSHVALDGTVYNFLVSGGVLYRTDAGLATFTDVTPVAGVTIDASAHRVYFTSFGDSLIISDGTNPPWLASDLAATPITGTAIDIDSAGTAWAAFGRPTIYAGSVFFILDNVDDVGARTDLVWSVPGDPSVGYQQTDYDFRWTLEQNGSAPLYAIWGTNVALYYWRETSIGTIAGIPGPDLQTTHTADAVAENIGTLQSATLAQYGNTIFFCDQIGRPTMLPIGGVPLPIWLRLRQVIDTSTAQYPTATGTVACAVLQPNLNLYVAAVWSPVPGVANPPVECQVIDAKTGVYVGRWVIGTGVSIAAMGILNATAGNGALVVIGSKVSGGDAPGGYVWAQTNAAGGGTPLAAEDGDLLLTEGGLALTTENTTPSWLDDGLPPTRSITTQRLGYASDVQWNYDTATIITSSPSPCAVTATTTTALNAVQGTPTPAPSDDLTYRLMVGLELTGRGVQPTVSPTEADDQWACQSVAVTALPSLSGPDDA